MSGRLISALWLLPDCCPSNTCSPHYSPLSRLSLRMHLLSGISGSNQWADERCWNQLMFMPHLEKSHILRWHWLNTHTRQHWTLTYTFTLWKSCFLLVVTKPALRTLFKLMKNAKMFLEQQIIMISEGSCDTEDWRNDADISASNRK